MRELLTDENNNLEKIWKTRVLFENTPRGNVIMYYDAFKQGFAYYCDQTSIPYYLLNAVAMKYVITYRCRDFFVDNQETPENNPSPLLKNEEPTKSQNTNDKESSNKPIKSTAFAKFKNYNNVATKVKKLDNDKSEKNDKPYIRNKFICLGKIINFKLIQPTQKKRGIVFKSNLLDSMKNDTTFQKTVMSYSDYKKQKQEQESKKMD